MKVHQEIPIGVQPAPPWNVAAADLRYSSPFSVPDTSNQREHVTALLAEERRELLALVKQDVIGFAEKKL